MSNTVNFRHALGDVLKDKVSGLTGVVMVRAEYSSGCVHFGLAPQELKNAEPIEWHWFDQSRLELVEQSVVTFDVDAEKPGGPAPSGPNV